MVDKGFLRIALGLIILVAISAAAVGVYLYFNFNSQSRLPLVVPSNATWFVQIQTKKLKEDYKGAQPAYYDSLFNLMKNAPIFKYCQDPATPGIGLFSDVALFETDKAQFLALSLTSESKFETYLDSLKEQGYLHGKVVKPNYTYVKIQGKNLYVAYKFKAMVVMRPFDTTENVKFNEAALDNVFSGKESNFIKSKCIQNLYNYKVTAHVIWYHKHIDSKNSKSVEFARGFNLSNVHLNVFDVYGDSKLKFSDIRNFQCINYTDGYIYDAKNLCLGTKYYENNENCHSYLGTDSFHLELNNDAALTSANYLNTIFKSAFEYLKNLK